MPCCRRSCWNCCGSGDEPARAPQAADGRRKSRRLIPLRLSLEVADIFRIHGSAWGEAHAGHVSLAQLKVMSAIETCRTAALGGHVEAARTVATAASPITAAATGTARSARGQRHASGSPRAKPTCCQSATSTWSSHCPPRSPTPSQPEVYDLLFRVAAETMLTIAADPRHLGARIGVTAVLHSWGSAMTHHPHIHMIVPGGCISLDGERWVSSRARFLLPVRVLAKLFGRLFLDN